MTQKESCEYYRWESWWWKKSQPNWPCVWVTGAEMWLQPISWHFKKNTDRQHMEKVRQTVRHEKSLPLCDDWLTWVWQTRVWSIVPSCLRSIVSRLEQSRFGHGTRETIASSFVIFKIAPTFASRCVLIFYEQVKGSVIPSPVIVIQ